MKIQNAKFNEDAVEAQISVPGNLFDTPTKARLKCCKAMNKKYFMCFHILFCFLYGIKI